MQDVYCVLVAIVSTEDRIEQISNIFLIMKTRFFTVRERNYKYRKEGFRINPVVLGWIWRYSVNSWVLIQID